MWCVYWLTESFRFNNVDHNYLLRKLILYGIKRRKAFTIPCCKGLQMLCTVACVAIKVHDHIPWRLTWSPSRFIPRSPFVYHLHYNNNDLPNLTPLYSLVMLLYCLMILVFFTLILLLNVLKSTSMFILSVFLMC